MKNIKRRTRDAFKSRILTARIMLYLNMLLWLVSGTIMVYRMVEDKNTWPVALVIFLFLCALACLFIVARIIDRPEAWVYPIALFLAAANLLMTFIGYPDFLFILSTILDVAILAGLIPLKPYYDK
ncbi:MAG: hypothetical protein HXY38_01465 [Chloroflexi bacterium]|nr:hypothetical protein [Chloroflexota bacterium]